jgi:DNA-binding beta-propeller fold protein YncE
VDETTLVRYLLERATIPEPTMGPIPQNAVRAGLRLRRRRRVQAGATAAAAVAAICCAAFALSGTVGHQTATPAGGPAVVYVLSGGQTEAVTTVTPISAANEAGEPIAVGPGSGAAILGTPLAAAPDGKTIWAGNGDYVTPISTATNQAGEPVRVVYLPGEVTEQVLVSPDGQAVYVLDTADTLTAVSTATDRARPNILLKYGEGEYDQMAITPDGKTLYVALFPNSGPSYIIVVNTARNRIAKRIRVQTRATAIAMAPDGKTVYVIGDHDDDIDVTPIATATNTAGPPVPVAKGGVGMFTPVAMTPDGKTLYISNTLDRVIPFATATDKAGKIIHLTARFVSEIAISPDGSTLYILGQPPGPEKPVFPTGRDATYFDGCTGTPGDVTPVATATDTAGKPIRVLCEPQEIAFAPSGSTAYVLSGAGVVPIDTTTGQAGKPIKMWQAFSIVAP